MRQNRAIHGEVFTDPNELVRVTTQAIDDFNQANHVNNQIELQERATPSEQWAKHVEGYFKVN
jgi:hypothetical protein